MVMIERAVSSTLPRSLGLPSATLLVTANMIGTGVFTTSGLLLEQLGSTRLVLWAWLVGGIVALTGALSYGQLAAAITRNGGEYRFLSDLFHPAVGFVAGWLSLVVGFSAPIAASAFAFGTYLHALAPAVSTTGASVVLIGALATLHTVRVATGVRLQNFLTIAKLALILAFIVGSWWRMPEGFASTPPVEAKSVTPGAQFAVALILVSFAYSGWNGAAYVAGEVRRPTRNVPLALALGASSVMLVYVGLNAALFRGGHPGELKGKIEIGHLAAAQLFGARIGAVVSAAIAVALASSVSAMLMVGPRVYEAMGRDYPRLSFLRVRRGAGGPGIAITLQTLVAILLLLTMTFDVLLVYVGFTLSVSTLMTIAAIFVCRRRCPDAIPNRALGYPWAPAIYFVFTIWVLVHSLFQRQLEALLGLGTMALGLVAYLAVRHRTPTPQSVARDPIAREETPQ